MESKFIICYLFDTVMEGKSFYFTSYNGHPVCMICANVIHMIDFIPQKNAVIFQSQKGNKKRNDDKNRPEEEEKIV